MHIAFGEFNLHFGISSYFSFCYSDPEQKSGLRDKSPEQEKKN
jgi:hypothetical protein